MSRVRGVYDATVASNDDPEKRGRIRVTCPGLMGDDEIIPNWIEPVQPWGWFSIPDVGEQVEIEATEEDSQDETFAVASIVSLDPRWKGARFWGGDELDAADRRPVPTDFTSRNYGKRRGFATPKGHIMLFDDTEGDRQLSISFATDSGGRSLLAFSKDGSFAINTVGKHVLSFDVAQESILIVSPDGASFSITPDGVNIVGGTGKESISLDNAGGIVQLLASNGITLSTKNVNIDGGEIALGGSAAVDFALMGNAFITLFSAHTHTSTAPGSPTSPPIPLPWLTALSKTVKVAPLWPLCAHSPRLRSPRYRSRFLRPSRPFLRSPLCHLSRICRICQPSPSLRCLSRSLRPSRPFLRSLRFLRSPLAQ